MADLLKGKVAIITGAAQGIGESIARRMGQEGANVIILDMKVEKAKQVAEEITQYGVKSEGLYFNATDISGIKPLFKSIKEKYGSIDILVNNAGISQNATILELTEEQWDLVLDINLKSVFFCSQAAFAIMKDQNSGCIINMSSLAGQRGGRTTGASYSASKSGVLGLTKTFALNGGPFNIRTNAICPGLIDTQMAVDLGFKNNFSEVALNRLGSPDEIAGVAVFLASDLASYVSGHTVDVNGAQYLR